MEDIRKRSPLLNRKIPERPGTFKLWCGKVQGLCDGTLCTSCHMFPYRDLDSNSLISSPSLVDHTSIGLIRDEEE
ncbi:MAG TPA: hypothetical protein ENK47_06620 [Euryarchaeota archaeon]|nr:MAG: hypothetical protein DRN57_08605 [Thermoplasmata archaeon]HHD16366.1 hypothetical protein [Euryarchaeota archaeon]